jgi:hypothetical protein
MDKRTKDNWLGLLERMEVRMIKEIFTQNWKGRDEGEDQGKVGK